MKPLSKVQKHLLQKLYYKDNNYVGGKRLYELVKEAVKKLEIEPIEAIIDK